MTRCLKCGHDRLPSDPAPSTECPNCGAVYAKLEALVASGKLIRAVVMIAPEERDRREREAAEQDRQLAELHRTDYARRLHAARTTGAWAGFPKETIDAEARSVVLVSTDGVHGREISATRGMVHADYAYAYGAIFEEIFGALRNVGGSGQSSGTTSKLDEGRQHCKRILQIRAIEVGGNAVVAVRFDYEEFSGANGRGVTVVTATGTAVWCST